MTDQNQTPGPWFVIPGKGHNARPFWWVLRRNPAFQGGYEYLTTPTAIRRFYKREVADQICAAQLTPETQQ